MANNISRKGLAFGALFGLGTALIAGTPAHAAVVGVTVAPTVGTSYNAPAGQTLEVTSTASSEIPSSSWDTFSWKVTNVDGNAAEISFGDQNSGYNYDDSLTTTAGDSEVYADHGNFDTNNQWLAIHSYDATHTSHYTVTSWLDANNNGQVDSNEYSQTQTVTFFKAADIATTTTIVNKSVYSDETSVDVKVVPTNINNEQQTGDWYGAWGNTFAGDLWVELDNGRGAYINDSGVSWNSTDKAYEGTIGFATQDVGTILSAQAYWYNDSNYVPTVGNQKLGSAATTTVQKHTVDGLAWSMPTTSTSIGDGHNWDNIVATNEAHQVVLDVTDSNGDPLPNAAVKIDIWAESLDSSLSADNGISLTVNGTKYTADNKLPGQGSTASLSVTSDAKGQVVLNVKGAGLKNNDEFGYYAYAENTVESDDYYTTEKDRVVSGYLTNLANDCCGSYVEADTTEGGKVTLNIAAYDQFGVAAPAGWDARVLWDGSVGRDTAATNASNVITPLVNGKATITVTDNGKGAAGYNEYDIDLQKHDPTTGAYGDSAYVTYLYVYIRSAADVVPGTLGFQVDGETAAKDSTTGEYSIADNYGSESDPVDLETKDYWTFDSRTNAEQNKYLSCTDVDINVQSASTPTYQGDDIAGVPVTVSGTDVAFYTDVYGAYWYTTGSVTVYTYGNGWAYVCVGSHTTGDHVLTVTSGGVTKKLHVFFGDAAWDAGTSLTSDAPAWSLPGKNLAVSFTLKDKFGNPITSTWVKLKVTGITGFDFNNWVESDSDGKITLPDPLILGINDLGALTFTVSYDQNDDGDFSDAKDLVLSKTVLVQNGAYVPADAKVAVSAPSSSQNGRAVDVKVTVTTAAGVAIPGALVNLAGLGVGYLGATTATTDANGVATVKLVAGADEVGDANITATAGTVSGTAKVSFGITDANLNIAGKRVTADWSFAAGKRVVIYRDGVQIRNFVVNSDASDSFSFNLKAGKHTVKIKVGGVTIDSQTYSVK